MDWPPRENGATPCLVEDVDQVHDVIPGGGGLGTGLIEQRLVVVHDDRLGVLDGNRIDLAVYRRGLPHRRDELVLEVRILAEPAREVLHLAGVRVRLQDAAAPAEDDRRCLSGSYRGTDLLLVGVVLEERHLDRSLAELVERIHRVLPNTLIGLAGQRPHGAGASSAAGGCTAAGGGSAGLSRAGCATGG